MQAKLPGTKCFVYFGYTVDKMHNRFFKLKTLMLVFWFLCWRFFQEKLSLLLTPTRDTMTRLQIIVSVPLASLKTPQKHQGYLFRTIYSIPTQKKRLAIEVAGGQGQEKKIRGAG